MLYIYCRITNCIIFCIGMDLKKREKKRVRINQAYLEYLECPLLIFRSEGWFDFRMAFHNKSFSTTGSLFAQQPIVVIQKNLTIRHMCFVFQKLVSLPCAQNVSSINAFKQIIKFIPSQADITRFISNYISWFFFAQSGYLDARHCCRFNFCFGYSNRFLSNRILFFVQTVHWTFKRLNIFKYTSASVSVITWAVWITVELEVMSGIFSVTFVSSVRVLTQTFNLIVSVKVCGGTTVTSVLIFVISVSWVLVTVT